MIDFLRFVALPLALTGVAFILILGLWTMLRGGHSNLSQKLMRWRVGAQLGAICLIMVIVYLTH